MDSKEKLAKKKSEFFTKAKNITKKIFTKKTGIIALISIVAIGIGGTVSFKIWENAKYIGKDMAIATAINHAGVDANFVGHVKCSFDYDDGFAEYDVEWRGEHVEYEYTISAIDGTVWESDIEYN